MKPRYEYLFVRVAVAVSWWRQLIGSPVHAESLYRQIIADHARDGWRLVQIFAPSIGAYGASTYYEIILERPVELGSGEPSGAADGETAP